MKPRTLAKILVVSGATLAIASTLFWITSGAHIGWSKSYTEKEQKDPITGIIYREKIQRFTPGFDILIPALATSSVCFFAGCAILILKKTKP